MKRILFIGVLVGVLALMVPTVVAADCCDYEVESCCWRQCCAEITRWYRVSYFERVPTGYFYHGVEMTRGVWTYQYVEARNRVAAVDGFDRSCFVSTVINYKG